MVCCELHFIVRFVSLYPFCFVLLDDALSTQMYTYRYGGERYEKRDLQLRVRKRFDELKEADQGNINWHMIDAAQTMEAVTEDIVNVVDTVLKEVEEGKELQKLWSDGAYDLTQKEES